MKTRGSDPPRATNLVLDTSAYSRFREGNEDALEWMRLAKTIALPTIVLGELEAGFVLGRRTAENRVAIAEFTAEPFVQVLPVTSEIARRYGGLFAALRKKGTPVGTNDIWIAATTIEHAGHLVTFDEDYEKIPGLDVTVLTPP